jgi:phage terminase large subunit
MDFSCLVASLKLTVTSSKITLLVFLRYHFSLKTDKVTFLAGQVVQTPEGLKFIAPDVKNKGDDFEFNLQGFQVTPEELELIKPQNNFSSSFTNAGDFAIDQFMMKQLAAAGMSIGRQVESEPVDIVLQSTLNREIVEKFCDKHGELNVEVADAIFKMIKTLTDEHRENINPQHLKGKILELCMPGIAQGN